ncbi:MAG: mechanosensitive ion channel [Bacteroidales bacterium]|nr:mechanosensitive ion channel [Bacteroidales bacterium]
MDLSDISKKTTELAIKTKTIRRKIIRDKELELIDIGNNKMIRSFDSLLFKEKKVEFSTLGVRKLQNKLNAWKEKNGIIYDHITILDDLFTAIDKNGKQLQKEKEFWQITNKSIRGEKLSKVVHRRIVKVESMIDTTLIVLDDKSAKILILLDDLTRLEVDVEMLIDKIETEIQIKSENFFFSEFPSIFELSYTDPGSWYYSNSMIPLDSDNRNNLKTYFIKHKIPAISHLLLLIFLIVLMFNIRKIKITGGNQEGGAYKKRLKIILSRPISSAVIVGLFAALLFYQNRPIFVVDLSWLILAIPIVIVLVKLLPDKTHFYVYTFGLLVFLHIINNYLPEDSIISRLVLFISSLLISIVLLIYIVKSRRGLKIPNLRYKLLNVIIYVLFILSFVGFIGSIAGKILFTGFVIELILGFTFVIILLTLSNITIIGLFILLIESRYVDSFNVIKKYRSETKRKIIWLVNIATIVIALYYLFFLLKIKLLVYDWLIDFFTSERNIGSITFKWENIVLFFLVIWLSTVIGRNLQFILEEDVLKKMKLKKGLPHTIAVLFKYSLVTIGVVIGFSAAGIPVNSMSMLLGAFGVGIGFGLQNIFNNLVSGLILLFERPIQINDTIEVGTLMGRVRSIGIRSSNVRTFDGAEIIVPNGNLISNEVINWTLSDDHRRIEVIASVSYESDPNQVKDILMKVIKSHPKISNDPAPDVLFREMGDSSLNFRLLFWTKEFSEWVKIRSEITFGVFYALKEAGIEIPFPQSDLHLRSIDEKINIKASSKDSEIE